jgi:hypothetical protein
MSSPAVFSRFLLLMLFVAPVVARAQSGAPFRDGVAAGVSNAVAAPELSLSQLDTTSTERNERIAMLLSAYFPGVGSFYAGNKRHGWRHVIVASLGAAMLLPAMDCQVNAEAEKRHCGSRDAVSAAGLGIFLGNWVWGIFAARSDVRARRTPPR